MTLALIRRATLVVVIIVTLLAGPAAPARAEDMATEQTTLVRPPFGHCLGITRVGAFHLFLYLGTQTRFNEPAGLAAVKLRSEDDPETGHDDDELTVFGLNSGEGEIIYNTSLTEVRIFGETGAGAGEFDTPLGIAADEWGQVVVADTGNDRVVRLRYESNALRFVETLETLDGADPPRLSSPSHIGLGASGTFYVTDTGHDRVLGIGRDGAVTLDLRGDAEAGVTFQAPVGLAVVEDGDQYFDRRAGRLVVADRGGRRLSSFDPDGTLRHVAEAGEGAPADARFDYLALDYHGSLYATDTRASRIHKFDRQLRYVTSYGRPGTGPGELDSPRGIAIWRRFGQVFITERAGAQYFWMGTDIQDLTLDTERFVPGREPLRVRYHLTEVARVTIRLLDDTGRTVHVLADERRRATGPNVERWDGLLPNGLPLPTGEYTLAITARPVYSAGGYFHDTAELRIIASD